MGLIAMIQTLLGRNGRSDQAERAEIMADLAQSARERSQVERLINRWERKDARIRQALGPPSVGEILTELRRPTEGC